MKKRALKKLEAIKKKHRRKTGFEFRMDVWEEIAMQINSYTGKEQEFWCLVMDLHNEEENHETT